MNPEPAPAAPFAPDRSFPVAFQVFSSTERNADLKGSGTFEAQGVPVAYRFTGSKRGSAARESAELQLGPADIYNVVVNGRKIRFLTGKGRSGSLRRPFVFFCRDAGQASEIAGLLPRTVDEDFAAAKDFGRMLRRLPAARSPFGSVTNVIVGLNVAVYLVMAGFLGAGWIQAADMTPYILYGANNAAATTDGEWWRLITSMFMHYGALHIALNMWALSQAGHLLERLQGRALYCATYLGSGLGGGFLSMAWHGSRTWSAGASGAIFGVYGALLGYMLREKRALPGAVFRPLMKSTLTFAGYNLLFGLANPAIDNGAHVGGLLAGAGLGWLTAPPLDPEARSKVLGRRLGLAIAAIAAMVAVGVATAPRFNYSIRDELAWDGAVKGFVSRESDLVARENAAQQLWLGSKDNQGALKRLIGDELVPFYRGFARSIEALPLSPGRLTDRRRKAFSEYARAKLEGFRHLLRAVEKNDMGEYHAYMDTEARASLVLSTFQLTQQPPR
jgi:rhomboid protease GluP